MLSSNFGSLSSGLFPAFASVSSSVSEFCFAGTTGTAVTTGALTSVLCLFSAFVSVSSSVSESCFAGTTVELLELLPLYVYFPHYASETSSSVSFGILMLLAGTTGALTSSSVCSALECVSITSGTSVGLFSTLVSFFTGFAFCFGFGFVFGFSVLIVGFGFVFGFSVFIFGCLQGLPLKIKSKSICVVPLFLEFLVSQPFFFFLLFTDGSERKHMGSGE